MIHLPGWDTTLKIFCQVFSDRFPSAGGAAFPGGVMSMASGSCKPFLKLRTLNPSALLSSGSFLPPTIKKTRIKMTISSVNPKFNPSFPQIPLKSPSFDQEAF
jgi:hypothetical protein